MARDQHPVTLDTDVFIELTDAEISEFSLNVLHGDLQLRIGTSLPAPGEPGYLMTAKDVILRRPVSDFAAGFATGRVYAKALQEGTQVLIDHA